MSLLSLKDESIAHCGARSADYIPVRCDVTKICDWRILQSISQTSIDLLVLDTRDVVQKYVVDQCVSNRVPWMSTVRQFIWERLFESMNYILEVVKLNNIHLFNTPHKRQRTNSIGLVSSLKSQTVTLLHFSFVMGTSMNFSLTRINHVHHHCQSEGNSNWAPNRTLFDA